MKEGREGRMKEQHSEMLRGGEGRRDEKKRREKD